MVAERPYLEFNTLSLSHAKLTLDLLSMTMKPPVFGFFYDVYIHACSEAARLRVSALCTRSPGGGLLALCRRHSSFNDAKRISIQVSSRCGFNFLPTGRGRRPFSDFNKSKPRPELPQRPPRGNAHPAHTPSTPVCATRPRRRRRRRHGDHGNDGRGRQLCAQALRCQGGARTSTRPFRNVFSKQRPPPRDMCFSTTAPPSPLTAAHGTQRRRAALRLPRLLARRAMTRCDP